MHVDQWAAAVAGVERRIGLNPCAIAGFAEFTHGADDSFGHAESHGATGIANVEDTFALPDCLRIGGREVRKVFARHFYQRYVQVFIDVHDLTLQMLPVRKDGNKQPFIACNVSVGGDHASFSDEEAAAGFLQSSKETSGDRFAEPAGSRAETPPVNVAVTESSFTSK